MHTFYLLIELTEQAARGQPTFPCANEEKA